MQLHRCELLRKRMVVRTFLGTCVPPAGFTAEPRFWMDEAKEVKFLTV